MTGAPLPAGADAVVMVEYTESHGDRVTIQRAVKPVRMWFGREAKPASVPASSRAAGDWAQVELGLLATVGKSQVRGFRAPHSRHSAHGR